MASQAALGKDEYDPELDFSSKTCITRRDPLGTLHTFSNLYSDEEEDEERENSLDDVHDVTFTVQTDACCEVGLGTVLTQETAGEEKVISYALYYEGILFLK